MDFTKSISFKSYSELFCCTGTVGPTTTEGLTGWYSLRSVAAGTVVCTKGPIYEKHVGTSLNPSSL